MFLTSFLPSFGLCSSPLCSRSCHPHRFFLLCQSGGCCPTAKWQTAVPFPEEGWAVLLPYLGGVASKVIFTSFLFFISVVLRLCVAWAVTLTGSFFFVRAEGVALLLPYLGGVASKVIFTSLFFISVVLSPLCSLSCHPHRFFLLCQSGGFAALLLPYLGGVASKVIFISLLNLFLCTTLVLVYLAWSPCTTLVLVYLAWSPWVYLGIHYYYFLVAELLLVAQISMDNAAFHPWIKGSHTASYNFGLKSSLEHPALLAGCVRVCTFSKEVKPVLALLLRSDVPQPIFARRGPLGKYTVSGQRRQTLYASCVNVPAFVETVDLRFCWWGLFRN